MLPSANVKDLRLSTPPPISRSCSLLLPDLPAAAMTRHQSPHFVLEQTEDGWMLEAQHITKDGQGDWMLNHDQLEELATLLQQSLA